MNAQRRLAEDIAGFAADPYGHALYAYPWGEPGPLQDIAGPRAWQADVLREIGAHLSNPATRFTPKRIAVASGHGIGKTTAIAMIVTWALDTCVDTRVIITANTEGQLLSKDSPELTKWRNLAVTKDWFRADAKSHKSTLPGHDQAWRMELIPWSLNQPEAFAGLHNAQRRIVIILDEAAGIPDKIWQVIEGALTDEKTEILLIAFGNPTRATGRFKDCFGLHRNLWSGRQIDSRTVDGVNLDYLQELVDTYGEDSDIVRVRVKGQFPSQSTMSFISSDVVDAARQRQVAQTDYLPNDPIIFGLDHARHGNDETVLAVRQGRDARSIAWRTWSGANSIDIASDVLDLAQRYHPDAVYIDAGGPNAGGIIDHLRRQWDGKADRVHEINFGSAQRDMEAMDISGLRTRVANRRAQMWVRMKNWLPRGSIPTHQRLADDLVAPEYSFDRNDAILLEKKSHMRARGLASPDWGDALALTFAEELQVRQPEYLNPWNYRPAEKAFDRYAEVREDFGDDFRETYARYGSAMPSSMLNNRVFDRYRDDD